MPLQDMAEPVGPFASARLELHDGSARQVHWTDVETPFPEGRLIVSRTGLDGVITHANDAFVEMSAYERDELIGAPHAILRHPEMPRRAFQDLWDTLRSGGKWNGYVKNLRKDGGYYWVYATAIANVRDGAVVGYSSVRRKPSRQKIEALLPVYRQWCEEERAARAGACP